MNFLVKIYPPPHISARVRGTLLLCARTDLQLNSWPLSQLLAPTLARYILAPALAAHSVDHDQPQHPANAQFFVELVWPTPRHMALQWQSEVIE